MVEWLVVVFDKAGSDRSKFRPQHLAAIPPAVESGKVTNVGAIFSEIPELGKPLNFAGSTYNIEADTREEVLEFIKKDVFAKEGIWDLDNILIYPYGCAARIAKK
ncbi:uncharacterized protein ASCRUDRAFT_69130 [Ascoidea rubescens DSM 1968]|uniref:YCII-related domain-containing protein n=1 Tax=Ascoidea rubescens DSM 1968 TaxID=1344418 RepID=A0A1D2VL36_9ASCO|nr:hypothetical protein ASCRUDRAFT_69130 [Ascoidea rubescens DSM 1968]ODV62314.1 hypothetical protein ASCRUDRAFT_69130 [Ascoidea rubescens DSM 1968]